MRGPDDHGDIDELMAQLNPVDEDDLATPAESVSAQALYGHITGASLASPHRRRRRRRVLLPVVAAVVAVLGFGAGGAYAGLFGNQVTQRLAVVCYAGPSLESEAVPVAATSAGPVAACAGAWTAGHLGRGPVPLLVACVTHQGLAAVFPSAPGADVCTQLGLPALPAGTSSLSSATTVAPTTTPPPGALPLSLKNAIVTQMQSQCLSAAAAKDTLTRLLANAGVDWSVRIGAFSQQRPCASPGFDEADHQLVIVGIPPLGPGAG